MTRLLSTHWIPTHRGPEDAQRFARWQPAYVKIVAIDEKPPYLEDVPATAQIIVRNHPMSELYEQRGFLESAPDADDTQARYRAYFTRWNYLQESARQAAPHDPLARAPRGIPLAAFPGSRDVSSLDHARQHGIEHGDTCKRMADYCNSKGIPNSRLLFEGLNEPMLWSTEPPELTAAYYLAFLQRLHTHGLCGVVGNFGVGWPGNGGGVGAPVQWSFFKPVIDAMQNGDYLGLHEYWALNGPQENWAWWAGRYKQCPYDVPILLTEVGIDTGVTGNWYGGWHDLPGSFEEKARRYVDELYWYGQQGIADRRIMGMCVFTYDVGSSHWMRFDLRNEPFITALLDVNRPSLSAPVWHSEPITPPPPPVTPTDPQAAIREQAWKEHGIAYNADAALARYARQHSLGNPVTREFDVNGYRAQGFAGGIVYCPIGQWSNVKQVTW